MVGAFALAVAIAAVGLHVSLPPEARRVNVRWSSQASPADRERVAAELGLLDPSPLGTDSWSYTLADRSREGIARIVTHPLIDDTHHLDRSNFRVERDASGEPWWVVGFGARLPGIDRLSGGLLPLGLACLLVAAIALWPAGLRGLARLRRARSALLARHPQMGRLLLLAVVGALTVALLVVTASSQIFDSNHAALTNATALLAGDRMNVDFYDPGSPLLAYLAAGTQLLSGHRLIGEFARQWLFIVTGVVIACHLGLRLSRSIAATAAVMAIALLILSQGPTYHADKLLFFPLTIWLSWRYVERPSPRRGMALAATAAIAFLFRHDFGLYLGVASLLAFALARVAAPASRRWSAALRDAAVYAATVLVLLLPWAAGVQVREGLLEYARTRSGLYEGTVGASYTHLLDVRPLAEVSPLRFVLPRSRPAPTRRLDLPRREVLIEWLLQVALVIPILLVVAGAWQAVAALRRSEPAPIDACLTFFAGAFLIVLDAALLRTPSYVVPVAPVTLALGAWLLVRENRALRMTAIAGAVISAFAAILAMRGGPLAESPREILAATRAAFVRLLASPPNPHDTTLEYLRTCTVTGDRLFITGSTPFHVSYYTGRPIAGGHLRWHQGWRADPEHQQRSLALLERQSVPFLISTHDPILDDLRAYPLIREYVERHYKALAGFDGRLFVDIRRHAIGTFGANALPCFR